MVLLDVTIVNIALPSIQTGLHMSDTEQQWVINAYTLVFGGFLLLGGRAADLFGRRRVFLFGLTLFSAASLVGGLATSGPILIGARAFQGLGARDPRARLVEHADDDVRRGPGTHPRPHLRGR